MQKRKKKRIGKAELAEIKAELQQLHPELKRLKVKSYPGGNRVRAFASIGKRRVYVRGHIKAIIERFTDQFHERLPTAF